MEEDGLLESARLFECPDSWHGQRGRFVPQSTYVALLQPPIAGGYRPSSLPGRGNRPKRLVGVDPSAGHQGASPSKGEPRRRLRSSIPIAVCTLSYGVLSSTEACGLPSASDALRRPLPRALRRLAGRCGPSSQAEGLGHFRSASRVTRGNHRVVGRQVPALAIFGRCQFMCAGEVPPKHRPFGAALEASDVFWVDAAPDRHGWLEWSF